MKKKGFTLIELLAVIVILAIIALIATPLILNVVEESKKKAKESSAHGYLEALEQYQITAQLEGKTQIPDGTITINDLKNYSISVKGEQPTEGYVTISKGGVSDYKLQYDGYYVSYNEETKSAESTKGELKGNYTVYNIGEQVTIDGVSYHVIKKSSSYSDEVTLLRDESIGKMKFDENGGADYETSTLKTYLNTTYKETFGEKKQYIKEITLLDFGYDETRTDMLTTAQLGEVTLSNLINPEFNFEEGTYLYLFKKGEEWFLNNKIFWTKTKLGSGILINAIYDDSGYSKPIYNIEYASLSDDAQRYLIFGTGGIGIAAASIDGFEVRPVIVVSKNILE